MREGNRSANAIADSNNEAIPRTSVPHSRSRPNRWSFLVQVHLSSKLQLPSDRVGCQAVTIYGSPRHYKGSELHTLRIFADRSYIFQRGKNRPANAIRPVQLPFSWCATLITWPVSWKPVTESCFVWH